MEETQIKKNFIERTRKKKATVNESLKTRKIQINSLPHKRSNSENAKRIQNNLLLKNDKVLNLITKGPSINRLFFKKDNISIKSGSMPKPNKKSVKKYRSINIDKGKNEIYNNIIIQKNNEHDIQNSNINLNYYNMDCIEKMHNLKGVTIDFLNNNKKSKKPNYINKSYISNDKLITFNNILNKNPIYEFYQPLKEKEMIKKPLQKIQSLNQEKREYKFSDFKVIKDIQNSREEDEDDESFGNINPEDYRDGNNIEFIGGSSSSEENDESSSLSSIDKDNKKKEKKKKKSDRLSNLVNKSIKNNNKNYNNKVERCPSQNYFNLASNNNSEIEDNYFINDSKIFMSPKINSKHPSNKSLKSDAKSDYFNNVMAYFNEPNNNNDKNSFVERPINKNKIRKIESLATNSNYDYEGDIEDEELIENGNQDSQFIDHNKFVNNLTINDSYTNIKSPNISQKNINNQVNNNANNITNIHTIKNNNSDTSDNDNINMNNNMINNNNYYLNNNISNNSNNNYVNNMIRKVGTFPIVNDNNNINLNNMNTTNNNNIVNNFNNDFIDKNNNLPFQLRNYSQNQSQSNIINIHNMNNFNNNNFIFGNGNSGINQNSNLNSNIHNSLNNILNNNINIPQNNNINIPQHNILNDKSFLLNKNNIANMNYYQGHNNLNDPNYNVNNFIMNKNNQINSYQLNQLTPNNRLINDNNNQFINLDLNSNSNRFIINNSNYFQPGINNINTNMNNSINSNLNNRTNHFYNQNNLYNLNKGGDNMNYLNYFNTQGNIHNDINNNMNNINNIYLGNNQYNYNSKKKKQKINNNNFINPNIMNQNMINLNNSNIINKLQYTNFLNQNNNMNLNSNININNQMNLYQNLAGMNNLIIPNNININPNSNINPNINNPTNNNMTNSMGKINHFMLSNNTNTNINNNSNMNKQKKQNLNLLSNEELAKQAYNLARYQNGCRYLQKRIENNQQLVPTLFFPNILGHIQELSNDQFGNYYIKIIIKYLPEDMIYKLIQLIHPSIPKIGTNQYGTKVLQYLIDFLTNEKNLLFFIEKTLPHVVVLINDLNGIHIIQRLICIKSNYIQLIYNKIFVNIQLIAVTRDGSNFIKKLVDFLDENNLILLINAINENLSIIITNQYGNYIIQNIIMKENLNLKLIIIETIIKNIVNFSNQKFSSNVVERCFEVNEMKDKVIDEILKNNNFEQILLNEYGNYVIQKALIKSDQNKQHLMFKLLVPLIHKLQCLSFGQKLLSKLFILYPRLSIYILNSREQI